MDTDWGGGREGISAYHNGAVLLEAFHVSISERQLAHQPRGRRIPVEHDDVVRLQHLSQLGRDGRHLLLDGLTNFTRQVCQSQ
eukprot:scaffold445452_cov40-Prasinocladus_malaysianus.AAC.1